MVITSQLHGSEARGRSNRALRDPQPQLSERSCCLLAPEMYASYVDELPWNWKCIKE